MSVLIAFSIIVGMFTVAAPCIWPVLPLVFFNNSAGKRKPLGIAAGVVFSFVIAVMLLSSLIRFIDIDPDFLRLVTVITLFATGLSFFVPHISNIIERFLVIIVGSLQIKYTSQPNGFFGGFKVGIALGTLWVPCAAPLLATMSLAILTQPNIVTLIYMYFFYLLGIFLPLLLLILASTKLNVRLSFFSRWNQQLQYVFGVLTIFFAGFVYFGFDLKLQNSFLQFFPEYSSRMEKDIVDSLTVPYLIQLKSQNGVLEADFVNPPK